MAETTEMGRVTTPTTIEKRDDLDRLARSQKLTGNPRHGGPWMQELY
jgi:hypothetical protein